MDNVFIAGCGYVGKRVAKKYSEAGAEVICHVRLPENMEKLANEGFTSLFFSLDDISSIPPLSLKGSTIFYLVPPPGGGIFDTRARNFIAALKDNDPPAKIIYMSATSVYSETSGATVTEASPVEPKSAMGKRRLDAEKAFKEYGALHNIPVIILRVTGIYGPGRLPIMQISSAQPVLNELESGMSNRIHIDDLVSICIAAAEKGESGDIFNISDGHPSSMTSYFNLCADHLAYPRQPQVSMEEAHQVMSPLMLSYMNESKIVDSTKIIEKLGIKLSYPDMSIGVPQACHESNFPKKV